MADGPVLRSKPLGGADCPPQLEMEMEMEMVGNVFCFNCCNRFTWFNMGRITKDDRCLIKTIKTENENITHLAFLGFWKEQVV